MLPLTHEPLSDVTWFDTERVPLAVARHRQVTLSELRGLFDSTYAALGAAIGRGEVTPAGPALAVFHGDPASVFDIEIGFPVQTPWTGPILSEDVTIELSEWPPGPMAALSHVGSYDSLGESWERLMSAVGEAAVGDPVALGELYVTEPSPDADPATMRTDLMVAVERTQGS